MDAGSYEPTGTPVHGMVRPRALPRARFAVLALGGVGLVAGLLGGLARAGVLPAGGLSNAVSLHAALMVSGFFGTVIGIERAVAMGGAWAFGAPLAAGLGALAFLLGAPAAGAALGVLAAAWFCIVGVLIVRRQRAPHTVLLVVAAACWLVGNALFFHGWAPASVHAWWFGFLVVTIAAERLEMTRLMRRRPGAQTALVALIVALCAGAALSALHTGAGGVLYGAALAGIGMWLGRFDIARRTVRAHGLSRFMAVALLAGYAWLVIAGVAWALWAAQVAGAAARDVALHAVGLGFVISMVMAHAPVILPAIARLKVHFGPWFYLPLALLHGSLALRVAGALGIGQGLHAVGAAGNALAIVAFLATMVGAVVLARRRGFG